MKINKREEIAKRVVKKSYGWVVGGYENEILDKMRTEMPDTEQLVDEIYDEVMNTSYLGNGIMVQKDIRFLGKKRIEELIRETLAKDEKMKSLYEQYKGFLLMNLSTGEIQECLYKEGWSNVDSENFSKREEAKRTGYTQDNFIVHGLIKREE